MGRSMESRNEMVRSNRMSSILAIHMGDAFSRLNPLLQKAHLGNNRLEGLAQVRRGNMFARFICNVFHFPKEERDVHLSVDCYHTADSMIWNRSFNGLAMQSHFRRNGEYLVEHLGPLAMSFKAFEKSGQLHYQFIKTRIFGIPVPDILSPKVTASECELDGRYHFSVEVSMFLIGPVIAYSGILALESLD